jgi:hypothetical protein
MLAAARWARAAALASHFSRPRAARLARDDGRRRQDALPGHAKCSAPHQRPRKSSTARRRRARSPRRRARRAHATSCAYVPTAISSDAPPEFVSLIPPGQRNSQATCLDTSRIFPEKTPAINHWNQKMTRNLRAEPHAGCRREGATPSSGRASRARAEPSSAPRPSAAPSSARRAPGGRCRRLPCRRRGSRWRSPCRA